MKTLQIEQLAYWLWKQRAMPVGSPEADWFLAEALLKNQFRQLDIFTREIPFFSVSMAKRTK